jgi:hypothetical protein
MFFSGESNSFIIFLFAGAFIIIGIGIFGAKATEITVPVPGGEIWILARIIDRGHGTLVSTLALCVLRRPYFWVLESWLQPINNNS